MDGLDRRLLTLMSDALPLEERPFRALAEEVGVTEDEVIERVKRLKEEGLIRRIGAVINPKAFGWRSTLCGVQIPEDRIGEYAEVVNAYPGVTHNYVRTGEPNCWFTLIAPDDGSVKRIIKEIEEKLKAHVLDLPASRTFKIKVSFDL